MGIFLFLIANLVVLSTALVISSNIRTKYYSDIIIITMLMCLSQIVLSQLFLGVLVKRLYKYDLLLVNFLVFGLLLLISKKRIDFKRISILLARIKCSLIRIFTHDLLIAIFFLCIFQYSYLVYIGLNLPPTGWDEMWYHLTPIASWYQEGKIFNLTDPAIFSNTNFLATSSKTDISYHLSVLGFWYNVYPMNSELISLWNIIFLAHDKIIELSQLPFSILSSISIYSLGRKLGLNKIVSILSGMLFLLTPIVIIQSRTAYVDISFSALVITSINFLVGFIKYKDYKYSLGLSISLGLLAGVKYTGVVFTAILFAIFLLFNLYNNRRVEYRQLILNIVVILTLGSFWYIKNIYYYQNPLFPFEFKIANLKVFPGLGNVKELIMDHNVPKDYSRNNNIYNIVSTWLEKDKFYSPDVRRAGFGLLWIFMQLPSIMFLLLASLLTKKRLIQLSIIIFLILFLTTPANWWTRYTIFIIGIGSISVGYLYQYVRMNLKKILSMAIIFGGLLTILRTTPHLYKFGIVQAMKVHDKTIGNLLYSDYLWAENLEDKSKIGISPMTFTYPFFGAGLKNKVYIVDGDTKEEWYQNIMQRNVEYVTVLKGYLNYENWANSSERLIVYNVGKDIVTYKVIR